MKLFELENLKVSETVIYNGEEFVLERIQQFKSGHIEYQFSGTFYDDVNFFSIIVTPEKNIKYNGGTIFDNNYSDFISDEELFDLNDVLKI